MLFLEREVFKPEKRTLTVVSARCEIKRSSWRHTNTHYSSGLNSLRCVWFTTLQEQTESSDMFTQAFILFCLFQHSHAYSSVQWFSTWSFTLKISPRDHKMINKRGNKKGLLWDRNSDYFIYVFPILNVFICSDLWKCQRHRQILSFRYLYYLLYLYLCTSQQKQSSQAACISMEALFPSLRKKIMIRIL